MSAGNPDQKVYVYAVFSSLKVGPIQAESGRVFCSACTGSAKTDPVRFKWGFREGLLKDKFAFSEAYKNPIPKRRKLLSKRPFL